MHIIFFQKGQFVFARNDMDIHIILKIDLTLHDEPFDVYLMHSLPIPLSLNSTQINRLQLAERYLAINPSNVSNITHTPHHYYMQQIQLAETETEHIGLFRPVINKKMTCAVAILFQDIKAIKTLCYYKLENRPGINEIIHLQKGMFFVQNVSSFKMMCPHREAVIEGCFSCTVQIPEQCVMQTDDIEIHTSNSMSHVDQTTVIANVITVPSIMYPFLSGHMSLDVNTSKILLEAFNVPEVMEMLSASTANTTLARLGMHIAGAYIKMAWNNTMALKGVELLDMEAKWYTPFLRSSVGYVSMALVGIVVILLICAYCLCKRVSGLSPVNAVQVVRRNGIV